MQVEQGWGARMYRVQRAAVVLWLGVFVPRPPNLPHPSASRGDRPTGNQGSKEARKGNNGLDDGLGRGGREPELQPRKGTDRKRLVHPTVKLHLPHWLLTISRVIYPSPYHLDDLLLLFGNHLPLQLSQID